MPEDSIIPNKNPTEIPEYSVWEGIVQRCCNPRSKFYSYYGGRGITICPTWRKSFWTFYADMRPRPSAKHTIDRINNDGNYEPGNCRWVTRAEQAKNRRRSSNAVMVTCNNETRTIAEWATALNVSYQTLYHRWLRNPAEDIRMAAVRPSRILGANHFAARFTEEEVREMRRLYSSGECNYSEIGRRFHIDRRHARGIIIGSCYKYVT